MYQSLNEICPKRLKKTQLIVYVTKVSTTMILNQPPIQTLTLAQIAYAHGFFGLGRSR